MAKLTSICLQDTSYRPLVRFGQLDSAIELYISMVLPAVRAGHTVI